jgi:hypothetical protein
MPSVRDGRRGGGSASIPHHTAEQGKPTGDDSLRGIQPISAHEIAFFGAMRRHATITQGRNGDSDASTFTALSVANFVVGL